MHGNARGYNVPGTSKKEDPKKNLPLKDTPVKVDRKWFIECLYGAPDDHAAMILKRDEILLRMLLRLLFDDKFDVNFSDYLPEKGG